MKFAGTRVADITRMSQPKKALIASASLGVAS